MSERPLLVTFVGGLKCSLKSLFQMIPKKHKKHFSQYLVKLPVHYVILKLNGQNLERNMHDALLYVLPKLYLGTTTRREDMTARTIIAKLVAFLFVQDSVRSSIKFI